MTEHRKLTVLLLLPGIINRCPYRSDGRDLRVRLAKLDMGECRNTSTSGGNDLVRRSWHTLQNPFAAEMSKIDFSVLANNYNYCTYRSDRRDLRIRLAKVDLVDGRNTSTSGGNDLVRPSWHTFTKPICGRFCLLRATHYFVHDPKNILFTQHINI